MVKTVPAVNAPTVGVNPGQAVVEPGIAPRPQLTQSQCVPGHAGQRPGQEPTPLSGRELRADQRGEAVKHRVVRAAAAVAATGRGSHIANVVNSQQSYPDLIYGHVT